MNCMLKMMGTVKIVNNKVVENLISFPESPGSLFLDCRTPVMSETSSYCLWHSRCIVEVVK